MWGPLTGDLGVRGLPASPHHTTPEVAIARLPGHLRKWPCWPWNSTPEGPVPGPGSQFRVPAGPWPACRGLHLPFLSQLPAHRRRLGRDLVALGSGWVQARGPGQRWRQVCDGAAYSGWGGGGRCGGARGQGGGCRLEVRGRGMGPASPSLPGGGHGATRDSSRNSSQGPGGVAGACGSSLSLLARHRHRRAPLGRRGRRGAGPRSPQREGRPRTRASAAHVLAWPFGLSCGPAAVRPQGKRF